jgi:probable rRNA maturation factor
VLKLRIHKETSVRIPVTRIHRLFEIVVEEEAEPDSSGQVNLIFTDDDRLRELNRQFRSKDKTTDVLSFNIDEPVSPQAVLGELYISVPFARRQAEGYGGTLGEELLRLICHGLLHLFGYDHQMAADTKEMEKRHEYLLNSLDAAGEKA